MATLNNKQIQYIFDTITEAKPEYAQPGTIAFAVLGALLSTGEKGIHIKSLEGIHIGSRTARSDNHFNRAIGYIRAINKILREEIGDRAPKLCMDIVGNQRVRWVLAKKADDTDAGDEDSE
jgi:hypothetical protein